MSKCIDVSGYLAIFDVQEPDVKYRLTKSIASRILENNKNLSIPLVVSHIDFRVDLTVGYVTDLKVDNKGLYCRGIIDNIAFIEVQNQMNEDFVAYFTKALPSPFLYLKSCLSCFSMAHDKKSLWIKHVALVDLGARRGTLIKYDFASNLVPKEYTNDKKDFYIVLGCYSRNALKLGPERKELLFQDAMICGETNTDFICAGKEACKKNIKEDSLISDFQKQISTAMERNQSNFDLSDALSFISNIASVLNQNKKRSNSVEPEPSSRKRMRIDEEPIVNASQTLVNPEPQESAQLSRDELNDFKKQMQHMQSEFLTAQSNMYRMMTPFGFQNQIQQSVNPQLQNGMNCYIPSQQPIIQTQPWPAMQTQPIMPNFNQQYTTQPVQNNVPSQQQVAQNQIQDHQSTTPPILPDQTSQTNTIQASKDVSASQASDIEESQIKPVKKTTETTLIEAGMSINESEHLINELFKHFIETNFSVKSKMTDE